MAVVSAPSSGFLIAQGGDCMVEKRKKRGQMPARGLDEKLMELTSLFEISRSLTSSLSIHSTIENILRIPMGHMLISKGLVLLQKHRQGQFVVEEVKGLSRKFIGKELDINDPPPHAVLVKECDLDCPWVEFFQKFEIELLLPLVSSQGMVGIVGYGKKVNGRAYKENEIEFLDSLSNIAATAVANGLNVEEIKKVNRSLDRKIQQLNTIFDISRELNLTLDRGKIASLLSFAIMGELLVKRCVVFTKENHRMEPLVAKGMDPLTETSEELLDLSEPCLLDETDRFRKYQDMGLAVLVPMRIQDETKGIIAIGPKISKKGFDDADLDFLKTLGNQVITSLENARLFEETLEKQRMEEELNLARKMQQELLPSAMPLLPHYDIAGVNIPSRQVGGDYYDVIPVEENRYGITIADVSGKGAGAALLMANLQASLRALVSGSFPVEQMVARINNLIHQNTDLDKFITFFYGELDVRSNRFTYCNAGHNPPYLVHKEGTVEELTTGGIILGMMEDVQYETATLSLKPGDRIVMYTDGITEAANTDEEEFGEARLIQCVHSNSGLSAGDLLKKISDSVKEFSDPLPQADDITMVVIKMV